MDAAPVTVIIPAFRAGRTIARAVASCVNQSCVDEVIVVHDGPDETAEQALRQSERLRIVSHPVWRGASACRNAGLDLARTPYVMFLDADDYVEGDLCASAAHAALRFDADIVFGRFSVERPPGTHIDFTPRGLYGDLEAATILRAWLLESYTPPCALVWRKAFVEDIGRWDESLAKNQDGDLMYRALIANPRIAYCDDGRGIYVQSDDSNRISNQFSRRTTSSQFSVLEKIRSRLPELSFDPSRELGCAYYNLARLAYSVALDDIGEAAERRARELGLVGEPGSIVHAISARSLGLRRKQRLAQRLKASAIVRNSPLGAFVAEPLESARS
jgi:glycosyltransferase involved in cell wall biosynthesis